MNRFAARPLAGFDLAVVAAWFAASRVWLAVIGVEPDPGSLERLWQLLPLESLRADLLDSVWRMHSQPPLFNLIVGIALHLPGDAMLWLRGWWCLTGLGLLLLVLATLRAAGMPRLPAHIVTALFALNPTLPLYENFLLYTYFEAALLAAAMFALLRLPSAAWAYGTATGALVAMRALFQPLWALAVATTLIALVRRVRTPATTMWLAAPVLVGVLLIVKNAALWDVWSTSSWYGLNLARLPHAALSAEAPALSAAGIVSPAFVVGPFHNIGDYPVELVRDTMSRTRERYGIRSDLTHVLKESGSENFNNAGQIPISRQLARDAIAATAARPGPVAALAFIGASRFLLPASDTPFLEVNRARLATLERIYLSVLYPGGTRMLVAAWLLLAIVSSAWWWLRPVAWNADLRAAAAFVCITTVYVTIAANLAEFGENNRFRFSLDPMLFAWNVAVGWRFYARIVTART